MYAFIIQGLLWLARQCVVNLARLWLIIGGQLVPWLRALFSKQFGPVLFILIFTALQWFFVMWAVSGAIQSMYSSTAFGLGGSGAMSNLPVGTTQDGFLSVLGGLDYILDLNFWINLVVVCISSWMTAVVYRSFCSALSASRVWAASRS